MASLEIKFGGAALPDNVTELKRGDELLWSEGTGRSASTGEMAGSVVAEKQTWSVSWGPLTVAQYTTLRNALVGGFKALSIKLAGSTLANITAYRGTVSGELMGHIGSTTYYKGVSVEFVER